MSYVDGSRTRGGKTMKSVKCDICGKECKNVKLHKKMAHPEPVEETGSTDAWVETIAESVEEEQILESPLVVELQDKIAELEKSLADAVKVTKSAEDIAKVLYENIVKPLGEEQGFKVQEWGSFDPAGYLAVARKIKE